jgi:GT2 family glycosyltransferase
VQLEHFVLTRFNVSVGPVSRGLEAEWLAPRLRLFEQWCLPSMRAQSHRGSRWLVFCHDQTPEPWRSRLEALARDSFEPIWLDEEFTPERASHHTRLRTQAGWLATTQLDNDDALAPSFVARLQPWFDRVPADADGRGEVVGFPIGAQVAGQRWYRRVYPNNPFQTLIEPTDQARTVYGLTHWDLRDERTHLIWSQPAWLQVVHGQNLANEIRGVRYRAPGEARSVARVGQAWDLALLAGKVLRPSAVGRAIGAVRRPEPAPDPEPTPAVGGHKAERRGPTWNTAHGTAIPNPSPPRVTALLTTFNRRSRSLDCLEALLNQHRPGCVLDVVLVDDASRDGTVDAIRARFPMVRLIDGSGELYWSGGMRVAQQVAMATDPDALLWLNDDVLLEPDALRTLVDTWSDRAGVEQQPTVVVGATADRVTGATTYSGVRQTEGLRAMRFVEVEPRDHAQACDTMHGNVVLVPRAVYRRVGTFDPVFPHAMNDFDYGLRAKRVGAQIWLAPGHVGTCERDHDDRPWTDPSLPAVDRLRFLVSVKGLPPAAWWTFVHRHGHRLWPLLFVGPYAHFAGDLLHERTAELGLTRRTPVDAELADAGR